MHAAPCGDGEGGNFRWERLPDPPVAAVNGGGVHHDRVHAAVAIRFTGDPGPQDFAREGIDWAECLSQAARKRRREFLAGRLCAHLALRQIGCQDPPQITRRPDGQPVWPFRIRGSITHTEDIALALVAWRPEYEHVGVDIETVIERRRAESLWDDVLPEGAPESGPAWPREHLFTLAFSAKESLFKALYPEVGGFFGFAAVRLAKIDPGQSEFELCLRQNLSVELPVGRQFRGSYRFTPEGRVVTTILS
jgi:enterobactin synthetase component D